jgi:hypothetical protein
VRLMSTNTVLRSEVIALPSVSIGTPEQNNLPAG